MSLHCAYRVLINEYMLSYLYDVCQKKGAVSR